MEFFIEKQILNIVYSVILGLIFGAIYDIIRIIYVMCGIASYRGGRVSMKRGAVPFVIFALFDLSVFTVLPRCIPFSIIGLKTKDSERISLSL